MKLLFVSPLLLIGTSAFALDSTRKILGDDFAITNIHECMTVAWEAAEPTDYQSTQAQIMLDTLHTDLAAASDNIQSLKRNVSVAWIRHPIDLNEVTQAKSTLESAVSPLRNEITATTVNMINLLNFTQRGKFDKAFFTCVH